MNAQEAADILGVNRRQHGDLLVMLLRALTLYPWLNTAEDEKRRVAVRWVLTHWKEYQEECARRREAPPTRARLGRCSTPIAVSGWRADAMAKRKNNIRQLHDHELELERALTDLLTALEAMPSRESLNPFKLVEAGD